VNGYALAGAITMLFSSERGWAADISGDMHTRGILVIRRQPAFRNPETEPHSIATLLKPQGLFELDDVVSALQLAWQQDSADAGSAPTLKFHERSAILIINGENRHRVLAHLVLDKMRISQEEMRAKSARP
jgi:hypothetical protein